MRRRLAPALLALAALSHGAAAQRSAEAVVAEVERGLWPPVATEHTKPMRLADRMRLYGAPAVSVAVVDGGRLRWARAWGVSEVGHPDRVTTDTRFQAASISKPLAALTALTQVEAGRLSLDEDIEARLRGWRLPPGAQSPAHPVTLRRLLAHTAGLGVPGFAGYRPGEALPTLPQILDGRAPANNPPVRVAAEPGRDFRYSGGGYVLVQQVLEDVTGEPFADLSAKAVFAPVGMHHSAWGGLDLASRQDAAVGHHRGLPIEGRRARHPELAAGGLWTTPSDLARLTVALQQVLAGQSGGLLAPAALEQALTGERGAIGLGFMIDGTPERPLWGHDGRTAGFEARWRFDRSRAVVVMVNANGTLPLADEIVRAVAVAEGWDDLGPRRRTAAALRADFERTPMFVRGSFNDWGLDAPLRRVAPGHYRAELRLPAGDVEFKIASADWQAVDLGRAPGPAGTLAPGGANLQHHLARAARHRLDLDLRRPEAPRLTLHRLP